MVDDRGTSYRKHIFLKKFKKYASFKGFHGAGYEKSKKLFRVCLMLEDFALILMQTG